ncbi:AMP-binding protein [Amycolatopsis sp. Hca4]|nr:AMP-binding protein [Amycolatopsis sp. Hca4]QKV74037.1 AMP-binding protein [Amycolatopsis sp. Hca4]
MSLTHQAVLSGALAPIERCELTAPDVGYQWLPLFHDFGMIGLMIALCAGFDLHLTSPATFIRHPAQALRHFTEHGVTICTGPNFAYDRLVAAAEADDPSGIDLGRWRIALNGGEQVSPGTVDRFTAVLGRYGLPGTAMTPAYGLAEFCAGISIGAPGSVPATVTVDRRSWWTVVRCARPPVARAGTWSPRAGPCRERRSGSSTRAAPRSRKGMSASWRSAGPAG